MDILNGRLVVSKDGIAETLNFDLIVGADGTVGHGGRTADNERGHLSWIRRTAQQVAAASCAARWWTSCRPSR